MTDRSATKIRVLFVNENIGGHATVHNHLRAGFRGHPRIDASFLDVPPPGLLRRIVGVRVPGLARLDLDFQPLRAQLALSYWVRRAVDRRRGTYDVLHVYTQNAALMLNNDRPVIISTDTTNVHNAYRIPQRTPTRFTPLSVALTKPIERRALRRCAAVVANSKWSRRSLEDDYQIPAKTLRTIPFGISGVQNQSLTTDRSDDQPTIGFVGRQFKAKGGDVLLDAYSRITGQAKLLIVSPEPVSTDQDVMIASDLEPGDDRLWDLLGDCSIFAFPSPIDQAPNAVLEAMAAGLPVVAVDTGAVSEMVVHGTTGFLVQANDSNALHSALQRLVDDKVLRNEMGAAGRRRFEERYDMSVAVEALADLFQQVVANPNQEGQLR
ncbi:MAG: glycosyltransferase family 4 protein [Acidimicrobiales bacterium]